LPTARIQAPGSGRDNTAPQPTIGSDVELSGRNDRGAGVASIPEPSLGGTHVPAGGAGEGLARPDRDRV